MRTSKLFLILAVLMITSLSFWYFKDFSATKAEEISTDAIAIRVMPNSEHFSPLRWYRANVKNQGTPQNLTVDGYEAVRDGRTVYVNAANLAGGAFFTNIYLMSYSQEAQKATEDIFGQLLDHWKFNINLSRGDKTNARIDTKRLADLSEMNLVLTNYKNQHNGQVPALESGSYVAGKSISKWPSWQATLGAQLGINLPFDPTNQLADCPGYADKATCWDQNNKTFYFNFSDNKSDAKAIANSAVYWYADGAFHVNLKTDY